MFVYYIFTQEFFSKQIRITLNKIDESSESSLFNIICINLESSSNTCLHRQKIIFQNYNNLLCNANVSVLDASAKPASSFLLGNNFWFGSKSQCSYVNDEIVVSLSDKARNSDLFQAVSPFEVEMKYVHAQHNSPLQGKRNFLLSNRFHLNFKDIFSQSD